MAFRGPIDRVVTQTAPVTEASLTTPVAITGCEVAVIKGGQFLIHARGGMTALDATARDLGFGVIFFPSDGGAVTYIQGQFSSQTTFATAQADNTTLSVILANTSTALVNCEYTGRIVVPGPGTIRLCFSRSAASVTFSDCAMRVVQTARTKRRGVFASRVQYHKWQTADQTGLVEATPVEIVGTRRTLSKPGAYYVQIQADITKSGASFAVGLGLQFTGTIVSMAGSLRQPQTAGTLQTGNATLSLRTTSATALPCALWVGTIVISAAGDLFAAYTSAVDIGVKQTSILVRESDANV